MASLCTGKSTINLAPLRAENSIFQFMAFVRTFAIFRLMSTLDSRIRLNSVCYVSLAILIPSCFRSSNFELSISIATWGAGSV